MSDKWERSNNLAKMVIKCTIIDALRGSFPSKIKGALSVHIKSMVDIAEELNVLGIYISSDHLAQLITDSLPENYKKHANKEKYAQVICNFCKEPGHMQNYCPDFTAWLQKRG
ncbi:unnamed protein product, partial [Urochloa humidicola]